MDLLSRAHEDMKARMPEVIMDLRAKVSEHVPDAPPREGNSRVQNAHGEDGDTAVLRIYDEIWMFGITADQIARDLDGITAPKIRVEINSPGGDVWDGVAIFNALRAHPAEVTTRVDGMAASIASVILQAGDHRVMMSGSQAMVHNAWGLTVGDNRDHSEMADILALQDGIIASIYAARAGKPEAGFRELMNAETWLTAERAIAEGLADEILDPAAEKPKDRLVEKITSAAVAAEDAVSGVERLVADHRGAGSLTEAKRAGLVALRDVAGRIDGLLNDGPVEHEDVVAARVANAKRTAAFQAALPPQFLG